jgi:two-component system, cell cycle response regulator DivK
MEGEKPRRSSPARILIVEDNELNLRLLSDVLEFHGYTITVAGNGADALTTARRDRPDLILLDIQLPDLPGTEVARRLKADPATGTIPIIAVTAFAMAGDRQRILESGCDEYISKPFSLVNFLSVVQNYTDNAEAENT